MTWMVWRKLWCNDDADRDDDADGPRDDDADGDDDDDGDDDLDSMAQTSNWAHIQYNYYIVEGWDW